MRLLRYLPLMLLAALAISGPAAAQSADVYTVTGVAVDISAANAAAAQGQALAEGQRRAFEELVRRLVPAGEDQRLPRLSQAEIEALVRDVAIESEKRSSVRYLATLSVRFKPEAVRRFLGGSEVPYTETRRQPAVVLPVHIGDEAVLWDDPNPWREVWARRRDDGLAPLIVPLGELQDVLTVTAEQALIGDDAALSAIARRHGAAEVLVLAAVVTPQPDGGTLLEVTVTGQGPAAPAEAWTRTFQGGAGESERMLLERAAEAVAVALGEGYKQESLVAEENPSSLSALVPLTGLGDWLKVRQGLSRVSLVRSYDVLSLGAKEAALVIHFVGERVQLESVLAQQGLLLSWGDGFWLMAPQAGGAAAVNR